MSDARNFLEELKTIQAELAHVFLCNAKSKKLIEKEFKNFENLYLIENSCVEPNSVIMVKDLELKKMLIEEYERSKGGVED